MNFDGIIYQYSHGRLPIIKLSSGLYATVVGIYPNKNVSGVMVLLISDKIPPISMQIYGTTSYEFDESTQKWIINEGGTAR